MVCSYVWVIIIQAFQPRGDAASGFVEPQSLYQVRGVLVVFNQIADIFQYHVYIFSYALRKLRMTFCLRRIALAHKAFNCTITTCCRSWSDRVRVGRKSVSSIS